MNGMVMNGEGAAAQMTPVYFEAASVIIALILLGRLLEARARGRTADAIKKLLGLSPRTARVVREGGRHVDVPVEELVPGDLVLVRPGEKVPTDGSCDRRALVRGRVDADGREPARREGAE